MSDLNSTSIATEIEDVLNVLSGLFVQEAELTFIMRIPGDPESHMVMSNDNLKELGELLMDQSDVVMKSIICPECKSTFEINADVDNGICPECKKYNIIKSLESIAVNDGNCGKCQYLRSHPTLCKKTCTVKGTVVYPEYGETCDKFKRVFEV